MNLLHGDFTLRLNLVELVHESCPALILALFPVGRELKQPFKFLLCARQRRHLAYVPVSATGSSYFANQGRRHLIKLKVHPLQGCVAGQQVRQGQGCLARHVCVLYTQLGQGWLLLRALAALHCIGLVLEAHEQVQDVFVA